MQRPLLCLVALVAAGCGAEPPVGATTSAEPTAQNRGSAFQPGDSGKINGLVTWAGPIPNVPLVNDARPNPDGSGLAIRNFTHPYAPHIDRFTHAVNGAVVFLREVNPERAKPWDLPAVRVEIRDSQIVVKQGERAGRTGFVRCGESVAMQSSEPVHHVLRGRGAAFFALPFPDPEKPLSRTFDTYGRVEITSAAGFYWQAADIFVCDHPYYAVTDAEGRFQFTQVPSGKYDMVAWHPNWVTTKTERNPESTLLNRSIYAPPLESSRPVVVVAGRITLANLTLPK